MMLADAPLCYLFLYVDDLAASREHYEERLGFRPIEEDEGAVKYDVGGTLLALNRTSDFGVDLTGDRAPSLIVFHASDLDAAVESLKNDGLRVGAVERYDIGGTAEVPDPDDHQLMVYEPSAEALTWPSADKIRFLLGGQPARGATHDRFRLGGRRLVYIFLFVRDAGEAADFYRNKLGLKVLESDEKEGVVKYDVGGVILATHESKGLGAAGEPTVRRSPMAGVFLVGDIEKAARSLRRNLPGLGPVTSGVIGKTLHFTDPTGHAFYLYQPSKEALSWPSGEKIRSFQSH